MVDPWEDVSEKAQLLMRGVKSNPHYLGALIIEGVKPNSPREVKRFLIIDGQQRLTMTPTPCCLPRHRPRERVEDAGLTTTRYLENADADVMEKPDEELFKLWPTTLNRDAFRSVVSAGSPEEVSKRHPLVYLRPGSASRSRAANLAEGYLYFSKMISAWDRRAGRGVLEDARRGRARAAPIVAAGFLRRRDFPVGGRRLAGNLHSLNSQGQPLTQSDLLRSLIFMRAEKEQIDRDEIFAEY